MNVMDIVKKDQKKKIGKYTCNVVQSCNSWWCSCNEVSSNESIFTQFNITREEIEKVLGYSSHGLFPQCKSAEDLTKVIEFIISKEPANKSEKEDYTERIIKALVNNPNCTTVQLGEEIKIVKKLTDNYLLDKTAKGYSNLVITYPLNLEHWELLPKEPVKKVEESPNIDMKAIQEECKKRFPIGCKFIPVKSSSTYTLLQDDYTYKISNEYIWAHHGHACLYDNGKWATLVSLPETSSVPKYVEYVPQIGDYVVMEKAGGWGYNHDNNGCIAVVKRVGTRKLDSIGHVTSIDGTIINPKDYDSYVQFINVPIKNNNKDIVFRKALPHEYEHLLPKQEVKSESMFKEGDYIVTLNGDFSGTACARKNYCFKQKLSKHYLKPEKDLDGSKSNGNTTLTFDKHQNLKDWRYATAREIAEYDRLGVPYDVTTLYPKLTEKIKEGIENTTLQENVYAYVGDPLPTTKPLIENVQSVSVLLRTKKKNRFKI